MGNIRFGMLADRNCAAPVGVALPAVLRNGMGWWAVGVLLAGGAWPIVLFG